MNSKFLEVHERLIEDKEQDVIWIAMFDKNRKFVDLAFASLEDQELVEQNMPFFQYVSRKKNGKYKKYAQNSAGMYLSQIIIGGKAPPGFKIDHENGNGLDNRRENLRIVSDGVNNHNKLKQEGCSSKYFGVCAVKGNKWASYITFEGKRHNLGTFDTEDEAAKVHDIFAVHFYKHHAHVNTKDGKYLITKEEVLNIYKHGVPEKYQRNTTGNQRDLPPCIYRTGEQFYYKKQYDYQVYKETFDTQEEAEEGLRILVQEFEDAERKRKEEIENNVIRNSQGIAILYVKNGEGKIEGVLRVDDRVWKKFIHTNWYVESNGDVRRAQGVVNGVMASIQIHIWRIFKGLIPPKLSVDHIDQDPSNNLLVNLRLGTKSLQVHNRTLASKSCFRFKGVRGLNGKFSVEFMDKYIGTYYYEEDAIRAYNQAAAEEFGENAALIPEPGNTRTRVSDYFSNLSIEFIENLDLVQDVRELFCARPRWGYCSYITKDNYKEYRELAIKMLTEEIENGVVQKPLPIFSLEYIRKIKYRKDIVAIFQDRPDWKKQHNVSLAGIKTHNIEEYKAIAMQCIFEELENLPVNDGLKAVISKVNSEENKEELGVEEIIELPTVEPLKISPMKELGLSFEDKNSVEDVEPNSKTKINPIQNSVPKIKTKSQSDDIQLPDMPALPVMHDLRIVIPEIPLHSKKEVPQVPEVKAFLPTKSELPTKKCNLPTRSGRNCKSDIKIPKIPVSSKIYF